MKRSFVGILSTLALALALPVLAQPELTASGTVVSSSATQVVIRTTDGRQITFVTDADTNRPSTLTEGSAVTVRYHDMNGTMHAASVTAGGAASPATPTAGSTPTGTSATGATATDRTRPTTDATGNDARTDTRSNMQQNTTGSTATTGTTSSSAAPATGAIGPSSPRRTGTPAASTATTQDPPRDTTRTDTTAADAAPTGAMAQDQDTAAASSRTMPATASPLPLVGLSGLLALAGGLGARLLRRRQ